MCFTATARNKITAHQKLHKRTEVMCTVTQDFFQDFLVEIDPAKHKARGYEFLIRASASFPVCYFTVFVSLTFRETLHYIKWLNRDTDKQRAANSLSLSSLKQLVLDIPLNKHYNLNILPSMDF